MKKNHTTIRKTAHRKVASEAAARLRIEEMRKSWKEWSTDTRVEKLKTLIAMGLTIRGLAADTGIAESTLRQYTKKASPPIEQSSQSGATPATNPKISASLPLQLGPEAGQPQDQPVNAPVEELVDAILVFLRAGDGYPQSPTAIYDVSLLLDQMQLSLHGMTGVRVTPAKLSRGLGLAEVFRTTEPEGTSDEIELSRKARWLATILVSMTSDSVARENALAKAQRLMLQPAEAVNRLPKPTSPVPPPACPTSLPPDDIEELPPHLASLGAEAKKFPNAQHSVVTGSVPLFRRQHREMVSRSIPIPHQSVLKRR